MALALYRKYRPRTFAEVIGQEHVTEPLAQALRSGRLHHAYLFSGPRGCGKTSSARILARSLNCEKGPTPEPCGECQSCRDLAPDGAGSIDVIEIDAASHGGVDDARELRERAFFAPVASRFKVYVIDEAHMVSSAGFNALLKLVEEPPDYVKFVFATTEPEKVLGTIKSRTHHYPFRLIPPGVLRPYLEQLCDSEGVKVEPAVFPLVVRAGAGSARDSLSVLDQLIAGAGPDGVSYTRAVALLGVTDAALIDEMCDALAAGDGAAAYATIDRVTEAGHDPRRFASDLLERLRDLIVLQQVPDAAAKGLLDAPDDQLERMAAQAARIGSATLSRFADIVHNGLTEMRGTTAPRLLLELICARMLLPGADDSTSALLQRLERMERRLGAAAEPASAPPVPTPVTLPPPPVAQPAPVAPPPVEEASAPLPPAENPSSVRPEPVTEHHTPGVLDAAAVRRVWDDEILTTVRRKSPRAAALVREATVREVEGNTLVLLFKHTVHAEMLSRSPEVVTQAVTQVFGGTWQIRCEVAGGPAGGAPARPAAPSTPPQAPPPTAAPPRPANAPASGPPATPSTANAPASGSPASTPPRAASAPASTANATTSTPPRAGRDVPGRGPGAAGPGPQAPAPRSAPGGQRAAGVRPSASADGDDGWPTPARPGGTASPPVPVPAEEWPATARPGGVASTVSTPPAGTQLRPPAGTQPGPLAGTQPGPPTGTQPGPLAGAQPVTAGPASPLGGVATTMSAGTATAAGTATVMSTGAATTTPAGASTTTPAAPAAAAPTGPATPAPARSQAAAAARAAAGRAASRQSGGGIGTVPGARPGAAPGRPTNQTGRPTNQSSAWTDGSALDEPPYDPDYDGPVSDPSYPGLDPGDEPLDDAQAVRETSEEQALRLLAEALGAEKIGEPDDRRR